MAIIVPKIVYNAVTLNFTLPPVKNPAADKKTITRHDNFSTIGVGQFITERTDQFRLVTFENVPLDDIADISDFMDWALPRKPFDYYVDSTLSEFTTYTLEDTDWDPQFAFKGGYYKFNMLLRKRVVPIV